MTAPMSFEPDPRYDLAIERVVDVAPELVFAAWTQPEHLVKWFTPKPWETVGAEVDLRPGGIFKTVMRSPEGQEMSNAGCVLEVIPNSRFAHEQMGFHSGWGKALEQLVEYMQR